MMRGQEYSRLVQRKAMTHRRGMLIALLYAVMATGLLSPMASNSILPSAPDHANHVAGIIQARLALDEGQFPLRVAPWQHNGWRYPLYQFYSPLPYTFAGLVYEWVTPSNPFVAYKLTIWMALTVAAIFIYRLAFWLTGSRPAAVLAGAMYMTAPYFLINIHARGAFTETIAQGVLPIVLYYSLRCYATHGLRWFLSASVSWFALATTHIITFVYSSLFIGLLFLLLGANLRRKKTISRLIRISAAFGFGCLLALYFLAPVMWADYLSVRDSLLNPYERNWLTPLPALLSPASVPSEPQPGHPTTPYLHPAVGLPMLLAMGVLCYVLLVRPAVARRLRTYRFALCLPILFSLALLMTWSPFDLWSVLPRHFYVIQFSYRLLAQVMWTGALLGAYALLLLFAGQLDSRHVVVGLLLIGMASRPYLPALGSSSITVPNLIKQPDVGYGQTAYLVKSNSIDHGTIYANLELPMVYGDNWLIINPELVPGLPQMELPNWPPDESPVLHLDGVVPSGWFTHSLTLSAFINGIEVARTELSAGPFRWRISLRGMRVQGKTFRLKFATDDAVIPNRVDPKSTDRRPLAIKVNSLTLEGLPPEHALVPVSVTQEIFRQKGTETVGEVFVPKEARGAQLPFLFYPDLLEVRVNGRRAPYFAVSHRHLTLVGLTLPPGTYNIRMSFVGLPWANWVSGVAWLGAIAVSGVSIVSGSRFGRRSLQLRSSKPYA